MSKPVLLRLAMLSVLAALLTIGMKGAAYAITGSAGLLSDALESGVNLLAAVTAYVSLWYAARPADATHTFGHEKIEFFASGLEGVFILFAGLGTIGIAIERLFHPQPLTSLGIGLVLSGLAAALNLVVALALLRAAKQHRSVVLQADGQHLMADVATTTTIVIALGLVAITHWEALDPILAIGVGVMILYTGYQLIRRSFNGLMDHALSPEIQQQMRDAIRAALPAGSDFHALRTREAGRRTFAEFHLLVPGRRSVSEAHALAHHVEDQLSVKFPDLAVTIHIEPIDEESSWEASELKRLGEVIDEPRP